MNDKRGLVWLVYLAIYPLPWLSVPPTNTDLKAAAIGLVCFLGIYVHALSRPAGKVLPHVVAFAGLGFALSPFGGAWSVYNIYALTMATRLSSTRMSATWRAIGVMIALQVALLCFGVATDADVATWGSGLLFGTLAGAGALFNRDLERRHRRLVDTQAEVRRLAAYAERERIAHDLHDLLGQTLTMVSIKAELGARLVATDPGRAAAEMEDVAEAARATLDEVRQAVTGMRAGTLSSEIARAKAALAAADIAVSAASCDGTSPQAEAVLAMVLREAVTNVIRHSGARACRIMLSNDAGTGLTLAVIDDGRGGALAAGGGIVGMRSRMTAAGGGLAIESASDGTRVRAWLPTLAA